jgi:23S rRNA (adenine2503-C2)-methyltransferase
MEKKIILKGMNESDLQQYCVDLNQPKFHGSQLYRWMYKNNCADIDSMNNIPKILKKEIKENAVLNLLSIKTQSKSEIDNTTKFLLETHDLKYIETVSMIDNDRHTICLSSQIGCSVDCDFCATGKMGITRNLSTGEIIDQLIIIKEKINKPITNIVFMGMGEPFLNYNNLIRSCEILTNHNAFNLSSKRITISTSGILPKIDLYIKENHKYKLAISLNASNNDFRDKIMPINKKWNIEKIITSVKKYKFFDSRPIMFEYVLLKGLNDSKEDAIRLANILKGIKCKVNLIPFNEIKGYYKRPNKDQINYFSQTLNDSNPHLRVLIRWSKGEDINAACGQLATINES